MACSTLGGSPFRLAAGGRGRGRVPPTGVVTVFAALPRRKTPSLGACPSPLPGKASGVLGSCGCRALPVSGHPRPTRVEPQPRLLRDAPPLSLPTGGRSPAACAAGLSGKRSPVLTSCCAKLAGRPSLAPSPGSGLPSLPVPVPLGLQPQDSLWEVSGDPSGQGRALYGAGHGQLRVQPELSGIRKGQPGLCLCLCLPGLAEGRGNSSQLRKEEGAVEYGTLILNPCPAGLRWAGNLCAS